MIARALRAEDAGHDVDVAVSIHVADVEGGVHGLAHLDRVALETCRARPAPARRATEGWPAAWGLTTPVKAEGDDIEIAVAVEVDGHPRDGPPPAPARGWGSKAQAPPLFLEPLDAVIGA